MNSKMILKRLPFLLLASSMTAKAMDIDLYTLNSGTNNPAPNVLIVLDNTSNWSRQDQHWPDSGINQGQAEVQAIQNVLQTLNANVNVGLLEFVTGGNSNDNGGFVRQAIAPMGPNQNNGPANLSAFSAKLTTIFNNTTSSTEKQNSGEAYGNLMYDAYNYLAGKTPFAASADVVSSIADSNGYSTNYTQFKTPLTSDDGCATTYIIFIGNPNSKGPVKDLAANTTALSGLGGNTAQLNLPNFTVSATGTGLATDVPTGTSTLDTNPFNADEWARFMYQNGVNVGGTVYNVNTYTIDVWYSAPNAQQSGLLSSMARNGGGKYLVANNESQIASALQSIFSEILARNSAFASASLPISATNRAQNDNQVYIGMFRPNPNSLPRWFGNMKRYQIANFSGQANLADVNGLPATDTTTGFITPCAVSWWTTDSLNYWANVSGGTISPRVFFTSANTPGLSWGTQGDDTNLAKSICSLTGTNVYSDTPDGPIVEKGGVAEMLRNATSRNILTQSGNSLVPFNTANAAISSNTTINANIVNFISGQDVTGEINATASTANRPSIHGDVIHSKPIPVDYGGTTGIMVFYGANDGTYHAVNAATGTESWAFVAPEFFPNLERLMDNTPAISSTSPKGFYFDGSTGIYQNANNSSVWIYPAMRRGGRMIYAFDVSTPSSPAFLWKAGCPAVGSNTGCTAGLANIGQTWSTPSVAILPGYSTTKPVVIVGGGYDACEDADTSTPSCSAPTGNGVYVFDAQSGALLASFATVRSVAADVALVDINYDGNVDAAYVADTGGNIYRIDFSDPANSFAPKAAANWNITRVAYTNGSGRKFLFAPAVLPYNNQVYVALGSGDREHPLITNYPYKTPIKNRFYVYLDNPNSGSTTPVNLDGASMLNSTTDPGCGNSQVLPNGAYSGWYMDLTAYGVGEQVVTSALITGGLVTFSTNRPVSSVNSCANPLGEARGYWVNLLNGSGAVGTTGAVCTPIGGVDANGNAISRSTTFVGGGLPPSPVVGNVNVNGSVETVVIGAAQKNGGASTAISGQNIKPPISTRRKRVYWRINGDNH